MATYKQIQEYTKRQYGFVPKTCWIAHVKDDYGLVTRKALNRINSTNRAYPCPTHRRSDIETVLKYFKMI